MNTNRQDGCGNHFRGVTEMVSSFTVRAYHYFITTQAEEILRREMIKSKAKADQTYFEVGAKVRQTIRELGGTMPEDLSTYEKGAKHQQKKLEGRE